MRQIFLVAIMALTFAACDKEEKPKFPIQEQMNAKMDAKSNPLDLAESPADRTLSTKILQAIQADDIFTTNAKNIKISSANGVVTLRGYVSSSVEKEAITEKVKAISGVVRVDNQIDVAKSKS